MTTQQTMFNRARKLARFAAPGLAMACLLAALPLGGCAKKDQLVRPVTLAAPYDTSRGDVLWAVVPLRNESGTRQVDIYQISDRVVAAAAQVQGVRVVPLNRTIGAMRALEIDELSSPAEARRLARAMGVDGLVLGSVTAWDPYNPPTLGLALALYATPGSLEHGRELDVRTLRFQPTDYQYFPRSIHDDAPASVVSEFLDGKNHLVQAYVQRYAKGRHEPTAALGWRRYLTSMDLFSEFAAWHAVEQLLAHESFRLVDPQRQGLVHIGK